MKEYTIKGSSNKMRYYDFPGKGTSIIFIHGLGCAGSFDHPNVACQEGLSGNRRILIDLIGAGYSDKPDDFDYTVSGHAKYLAEFVAELNFDKLILFGHSFGGSVALSLASLCEGIVSHVILAESNLDSGGGPFSRAIAAFEMNDFASRGLEQMVEDNIRSGNSLWASSLSMWSPRAAYGAAKSLVEGCSPSWREILYSLKCRKTFIYGEGSLPNADMQALIDNGIHLEVVKDAGHSMTWENPKGLAAAIKNGIMI